MGLDIDQERMPKYLFSSEDDPPLKFTTSIIDATSDLVCAYKLNLAFYEVFGRNGFDLLERTVQHIPKDIVVILDGKRNDIGNTMEKYARSLFDILHADAVTINPYLGRDTVHPFLAYKDKCCFILCRTSNPSAGDFQDLSINGVPFYQVVAQKIKEWNMYGNCGAVVGATYPDELEIIRGILGDEIPILIPGVGKQSGSVEQSVKNGVNSQGELALINSSRDIIFAGTNRDFAEESRHAAERLRDEMNKYR